METLVQENIIYPSYDNQPMADNSKQFRLMTLIKENLEHHFANRNDVFVAGDLLWYPVQGQPKIKTAPDVMVVFGVEKKDRKSYIQHQENSISPQVVIEIISDSNRENPLEMIKKFIFYQEYGVEEYYIFDPETAELEVFLRQNNMFSEINPLTFPFASPLLGITFEILEENLALFYPNGDRFLSISDLKSELEETQSELTETRTELEIAREKAEKLAQKLREMGINPEEA